MKHNEGDKMYAINVPPDELKIADGTAAALDELEEKQRLSIAMSSYYLLYR